MSYLPSNDPDNKEDDERRKLLSLPFEMPIEDIFTIKDRGVIVGGQVKTGALRKGDKIRIVGSGKSIAVTSFSFEFPVQKVETGDKPGILIRDVTKEDIEFGMRVISDN
jgi:elongation factor Tu